MIEMFRIKKVSSFDQPELAPYRTMRRSAEHESQGIFVAEGLKVVRRMLESHFTVVSVVFSEEHLEQFSPLLEARTEDITVYLADRRFLVTLTGFSLFQGVLGVGRIPPPSSLDDILARIQGPKLLVAIDALSNAENLGAIIRNCAAFDAHALIVGETSSSPFLRRAVRNSMGTIFQLPVVELKQRSAPNESQGELRRRDTPPAEPNPTLAETLRGLRTRGIRCIAAHPRADGKTLAQTDFTDDCCIVFGSEGDGISEAVLESCDEAVAIPMPPTIDSLNVGAAAAVFLYEVQRQRKKE